MKFSYQWIQELVPGLDTPVEELEDLITVRTAECEGIEIVGALLDGAKIARVLTAESVPNTHITKALVDVGEHDPITVACGAPNCRAGLATVWVPLGKKTIQGVDSNGMLASGQELGIAREHEGIVEWNEPTLSLQPDYIIDIDNKSLTHRPDLWGHLGMAREVAAIRKKQLRDPVDLSLLPGGSDSFDIRVEDFDLCPRFSSVVFENVKVAPSPFWLQYRLTSVGVNPINNIVDITNYVAAELAQPMHAFDRSKLDGERLIVRLAREGESMAALNGETYTFAAGFGVVADRKGPVSLAGIIGGQDSAISADTTDVVFESANWKASTIRQTSAALKLRTDASMRFEKAQDPANTVRALARAIALMRIVSPEARLVGRLTDVYESLPRPQTIELRLDLLDRKLGRIVPPGEVRDILERLAFHVHPVQPGGPFQVTIPSWRATKDISVPEDLVEEVGRMIGYDTIDPTPPLVAAQVPAEDPRRKWYRDLRTALAARGYSEVYNYSFLSDEQACRFELLEANQIRLLNPIASDQNILRSSLIPGLVANIETNAKHFPSFQLFEMGREIHNRAPALPLEVPHLVAAVYTGEGDGASGLFELKGVAEGVVPHLRTVPTRETLAYEHPARAANLVVDGTVLGRLFELHPDIVAGRAAILDLNLDRVYDARPALTRYRPIQRFPSSAFDLSIVALDRELAAVLEGRLRSFAGPLLETTEYLREYRGPQVPPGSKSVSYRITLAAPDRTLSNDEINTVRTALIEGMRGLGYEIRA